MTDDIKLYKLATGQEIIGRVIETNFSWVMLQHVLTFRVVQQGPDQYGLDLSPFSPTMPEGKWKYNTNQILAEGMEVPEALKKAYTSRVSNIEIVSSLDEMERLSKK
jgi:hypothetical protein